MRNSVVRSGMLTKVQFLVIVLGVPSLIIPAFLLLRFSEKGPLEKEEFVIPKSTEAKHVAIRSFTERIKVVPQIPKCTNLIWEASCKDPCHRYSFFMKNKQRQQETFICDKYGARLKVVPTSKPKYLPRYSFRDDCLKRIVDWYCQDGKPIPNIVHYVWLGKMDFKFIHFLSFLSVHKIQKPRLIFMHTDHLPQGVLWRYFLQIAPNVIHVHRKQPKKIFKKKIPFVEHRADVVKLEALREYGGIYLDTDEILLKPLDKFRQNYEVTMSKEYDWNIANSLIIARKNSAVLKAWYNSYKSYSKTDGNKHSNSVPFKLAIRKFRDKVHVVENLFSKPHSKQLSLIYSNSGYDWSKNYGMHMYLRLHDRFYKGEFTLDNIQKLNTTAGEVARYVIYGTKDMCTRT